MQNLKKLISFAIATVTAVVFILWCLDAFGFSSPLFAFLANWVAMSWIAFNGQSFQAFFPPDYYAPRPFEHAGRIYELLGIRLFKALVRRGPLAIFSPTLRFPKKKTVPALRALETEMRKAETGHVLVLALVLVPIGYALLQGWYGAAAWLSLFNILINGYPILLQRYNRIKLQELVDRQATGPIDQLQAEGVHGGPS
jgi:nitrate reductase NapE component